MKTYRNYWLLLASQFLSAFGDNALIAVILGPLTFLRDAGKITAQQVNSANAIYSAVFFLPFVLLAPLAGFLNDRYAKTTWLKGGNLIKLLGTSAGLASLSIQPDWQALGYCLVGVGACCYSPAKYGILPEILPGERLVKANGTVEMLTLAAILTGLWAGAKLVDQFPLRICYGIVMGIYGLSFLFNLFMQRTPGNPEARFRHSLGEFGQNLKTLLTHARLAKILFGTGLFWLCGATLRTNLQSWGLDVLKQAGPGSISNAQLALLKIWLAVGIIIGSLLAGQLHRVGDLRWTRYYAWLMALFILPLGLLSGQSGLLVITLMLVMTGLSAGLFLIPLNAALQAETDHTKLGKTIATQNFVDYLSMLAGAAFVATLTKANLTAANIFVALAILVSLIAIWLRIPTANPVKSPLSTVPDPR